MCLSTWVSPCVPFCLHNVSPYTYGYTCKTSPGCKSRRGLVGKTLGGAEACLGPGISLKDSFLTICRPQGLPKLRQKPWRGSSERPDSGRVLGKREGDLAPSLLSVAVEGKSPPATHFPCTWTDPTCRNSVKQKKKEKSPVPI